MFHHVGLTGSLHIKLLRKGVLQVVSSGVLDSKVKSFLFRDHKTVLKMTAIAKAMTGENLLFYRRDSTLSTVVEESIGNLSHDEVLDENSKYGKDGSSTLRRNKKIASEEISIGTLNLIDGRGNRLELACRELEEHNVDVCIVTETKLNGYHTINLYGYNITAAKCDNVH